MINNPFLHLDQKLLRIENSIDELQKQIHENQLRNTGYEVYLTSDEVCKILSISKVTLWHWDGKGITNPLKIGNKKRYRKSEIEAAFQEKEKGHHE